MLLATINVFIENIGSHAYRPYVPNTYIYYLHFIYIYLQNVEPRWIENYSKWTITTKSFLNWLQTFGMSNCKTSSFNLFSVQHVRWFIHHHKYKNDITEINVNRIYNIIWTIVLSSNWHKFWRTDECFIDLIIEMKWKFTSNCIWCRSNDMWMGIGYLYVAYVKWHITPYVWIYCIRKNIIIKKKTTQNK